MFETPNAGFAGVFVMDEVSPLASQLVREHLLERGCFDMTMTPIDTSSWFPSLAELERLVRLLNPPPLSAENRRRQDTTFWAAFYSCRPGCIEDKQ